MNYTEHRANDRESSTLAVVISIRFDTITKVYFLVAGLQ